MNLDINQVLLVGTLTTRPELKYTQSNIAIAKLRVTITELYRTAEGEQRESKSSHNVVVWGRKGENIVDQTNEGSRVFLKGKIQNRSYKDQYGNDKWVTEINAHTIFPLDETAPPASQVQRPQQVPQQTPQNVPEPTPETVVPPPAPANTVPDTRTYIPQGDDDLPF